MKREKLVRYLMKEGCELLRQESRHSIFINVNNRQTAPIPRQREIGAGIVT